MGQERSIIVCWQEDVVVDSQTAVSLYHSLCAGEDFSFLLESVEGGEKWARFSFAGWRPLRMYTLQGGRLEVRGGEGRVISSREVHNPIYALREELLKIDLRGELSFNRLAGGVVGYVAYDLIRYFENLSDSIEDDLNLPEFLFIFPSFLVVHDNLKHRLSIVCFEEVVESEEKALKNAQDKVSDLIGRLKRRCELEPFKLDLSKEPPYELKSNFTREEFESGVSKVRDYILDGEAIQVVLSQRFEVPAKTSPFNVYRALRIINPSPYMYYMKMGDFTLVGSSPEVMARVGGRKLEVRPIAGTRPRGRTEREDQFYMNDLLSDEKEKAEHVMLVDLGRNDVGRVCKVGSVNVTEYMVIEKYSHVMHLVSHVEGELEKGKDAFDAFISTFPAGTVSGAPKVRAMEIIDEIENVRRGPYAGSVGYFDLSGNMDMAITIRTILFKGDRAYVQAGAGIVADSIPEREYEETVNKARALLKAVELAP